MTKSRECTKRLAKELRESSVETWQPAGSERWKKHRPIACHLQDNPCQQGLTRFSEERTTGMG
eukprot:2908749-Alexandrium_andersonii.AAC.1